MGDKSVVDSVRKIITDAENEGGDITDPMYLNKYHMQTCQLHAYENIAALLGIKVMIKVAI